MASKLEEHEVLILKELKRGVSYEVISKKLISIGCQTSKTNLFLWIKRRSVRIQRRQVLIVS